MSLDPESKVHAHTRWGALPPPPKFILPNMPLTQNPGCSPAYSYYHPFDAEEVRQAQCALAISIWLNTIYPPMCCVALVQSLIRGWLLELHCACRTSSAFDVYIPIFARRCACTSISYQATLCCFSTIGWHWPYPPWIHEQGSKDSRSEGQYNYVS